MAVIVKTYTGSETRKLIPEDKDCIGVVGDNDSTIIKFKVPAKYMTDDWVIMIEWDCLVKTPEGELVKPMYNIDKETMEFKIPIEITSHESGKKGLNYNLILHNQIINVIEKSRQSTLLLYGSAQADYVAENPPNLFYELLRRAFVEVKYSENEIDNRPHLTFNSLINNEFDIALNMPFLTELGVLDPSFVNMDFVTALFAVKTSEAVKGLEAKVGDWAVVIPDGSAPTELYLCIDVKGTERTWYLANTNSPAFDSVHITGDAIIDGDLTLSALPGKVIITDENGKVISSKVTVTELDAVSGISSNIQTQLNTLNSGLSAETSTRISEDADIRKNMTEHKAESTAKFKAIDASITGLQNSKQDNITGGATTILSKDLTASRALQSDVNGKVAVSQVSSTELGYVKGVKSAIQTQLNDKVPRNISGTLTTDLSATSNKDSVTIKVSNVKPADGTKGAVDKTFPIADSTKAGAMSAGTYKVIEQHTADIEQLKGRSIRYVVKLTTDKPTQQQLTQAYNAITPKPPSTIVDGTTLVDVTYNKEYTWFSNSNEWVDRGTTVVNIATNSSYGIVKGSTGAGKASVDADGTLTVNGYASLANTVSGHVQSTANPHKVTKAQVGLSAVDNTSDADKPISTATQNALDLKADDSDVVHKSGDEEISGKKTYNGYSNFNAPLRATGVSLRPTEYSNARYYTVDSGYTQVGVFGTSSEPKSNRSYMGIHRFVVKPGGEAESLVKAEVTVYVDANGDTYAICPTPFSNKENSNKIATTEWVNSAFSVVHTDKNEEITGDKTFSGGLYRKSKFNASGIASNNQYVSIISNAGADNQAYGFFRYFRTKDKKDNRLQICVNSIGDTTTSESAYFQVVAKSSDGPAYASCPVTPDDATSNQIVTANWANSKYVAKTGSTMTGDLTIESTTPDIVLTSTTLPIEHEGARLGGRIQYMGTNGQLGEISALRSTPLGFPGTAINARVMNKHGTEFNIGMWALDNGQAYGYSPTPFAKDDYSDKIATTKWVHDTTQIVHTDRNEEILGEKTFNGRIINKKENGESVVIQNTLLDNEVVPDATRWNRVSWKSWNNKDVAGIQFNKRPTTGQVDIEHFVSLGGKTTWGLSLVIHPSKGSYATAPTTPDDSSANEIVTANYLNGKLASKSDDANVVHKTGDETIDGVKNFQHSITNERDHYLMIKGYKNSEVPSSRLQKAYFVSDEDLTNISAVRTILSERGNRSLGLELKSKTGIVSNLTLWSMANNEVYATAPTPANDKENSNKIATTEWVNKAFSVVHKDKNEEISGQKTFLSTVLIYGNQLNYEIKNPNLKRGVTPSASANYGSIAFRDKDNNVAGGMYGRMTVQGECKMVHYLTRSNGTNYEMGLKSLNDGVPFGYAPATPTNADGTEIVTAGWSNAKYVKKAGDTMTGSLNFNGAYDISARTLFDNLEGKVDSYHHGSWHICKDKADRMISNFGSAYDNGNTRAYMEAWRTFVENGKEKEYGAQIRAHITNKKEAYATCPTPIDKADNSNKIPTTNWVHDTTQVVHTDRNEEIGGTKTFTGSIITKQDYPVIQEVISKIPTPASNPKSQAIGGLRLASQNGGYLGQFRAFYDTNGNRKLLCTIASVNGTNHELEVFTDKDGNSYAKAPTTPDDSSANEIVTADYLNGIIAKLNERITALENIPNANGVQF